MKKIKFDSNNIRKIKTKLYPTKIANYYKIELNKSNFSLCPFHNDHKPSMSWSDKKGLIKCFVCMDKAVDVIGFIEAAESLSFEDAVKFISEKILKEKNIFEIDNNDNDALLAEFNVLLKKDKVKKYNKEQIKQYFDNAENKLNDCYYILRDLWQMINTNKGYKFNWAIAQVYYFYMPELDYYDEELKYLKSCTELRKKFDKNFFNNIFLKICGLFDIINNKGVYAFKNYIPKKEVLTAYENPTKSKEIG